MSNKVNVMVQIKGNLSIATTSFSPFAAAPALSQMLTPIEGVEFDATYSPVPLASPIFANGMAQISFGFEPEANQQVQTYIVRASVDAESMDTFLTHSKNNSNVIGVFADPVIQPISVCPTGPIGTDHDVENLLALSLLQQKGMTGAGVKVAIVDTGINLTYLNNHGKSPNFDITLSWGPTAGQPLGNMPVDHGTMCSFDVCIAAPACTILDHAVLSSHRQGGSVMDGFLSDAVASYAALLSYMMKAPSPFAGDTTPRTLVVNNSWGMFNPSWDFPVGNSQNYSDNPQHPFNIIVSSLEAAGADILFAAGNCGPECPDSRCQGATNNGIYGANSSPKVLSVAGVSVNGDRLGYSTKGPGHLDANKPDIASYTHFAGSGVYAADGGTSAATPVLTGIIAAIRRRYPSNVISPAKLRDLVRQTATNAGPALEYGAGIVNVSALIEAVEAAVPNPQPAAALP